jgi:phosphoglycerate dehydrogenase-like enzyme
VATALLTDAERFPFDDEDHDILERCGVDLTEVAGHDPDAVAAAADGIEAIFVYSGSFDAALIARLPSCRMLARCGVGFDNIDLEAARRRGMVVTYVPSYGADDVAEHALALVLAAARRLRPCGLGVDAGRWPSYRELGPMRRVAASTLGVLGLGRIGRALAWRAAAIGMTVIAHDPYVVDTEPRWQAGPGRAGPARPGPERVGLDELLRRSDYLSVHLPLTAETRHLVGRRALSLMKPTAFLVNTSRGAVVDEAALAEALAAGSIAGAGLDVLETEPPAAGDPLLGRSDVTLTPHSAAYTEEALAEVRRVALEDVTRVLAGSEPLHPVPAPAG